jgi:hypothetical protein
VHERKLMFLLGLIAAICFVPGYTGAAIPAQWALFSIALPFFLWWPHTSTGFHWLGLIIASIALLSLWWVPNLYDAGYGLWLLGIWALAFHLGTTEADLPALFRGLAVGLTASSAIAIAQTFGFAPVLSTGLAPSGLFFNSTVLGASAALVLIALICLRQWAYIPGLLPALYLSHSRGAWVALAATAVARIAPWYITVLCLCLGFGLLSYSPSPSDIQRLMLWGVVFHNWNFLGHGIGSFISLVYYNPHEYYRYATGLFQAGFAHNDYLQLWFELGLGAIPFYIIYLSALHESYHRLWPAFVAFAILGLFYFPLWVPLPSFIGCVLAGRLLACRNLGWNPSYLGRFDLPYGRQVWEPFYEQSGCSSIPIKPRA